MYSTFSDTELSRDSTPSAGSRAEARHTIEACIVAMHETRVGFMTIKGHGWVRFRRGVPVDGRCTGYTEYLQMRSYWEQTGF